MKAKEITFKISRYKAGVIDPAEFFTYMLKADEQMSVLNALEHIRLRHEPTLVYRHSCHHSSCGTCACIINGTERLACTTKVLALDSPVVTIEPLKGFERLADLAVLTDTMYREISGQWSYLQPAETSGNQMQASHTQPFQRFENCIECGSCMSACPVSQTGQQFIGPAVLAAVHREFLKSPASQITMLELASGPRGERWCQRALACSRVCPTKVYPARHIADLRRLLHKK